MGGKSENVLRTKAALTMAKKHNVVFLYFLSMCVVQDELYGEGLVQFTAAQKPQALWGFLLFTAYEICTEST